MKKIVEIHRDIIEEDVIINPMTVGNILPDLFREVTKFNGRNIFDRSTHYQYYEGKLTSNHLLMCKINICIHNLKRRINYDENNSDDDDDYDDDIDDNRNVQFRKYILNVFETIIPITTRCQSQRKNFVPKLSICGKCGFLMSHTKNLMCLSSLIGNNNIHADNLDSNNKCSFTEINQSNCQAALVFQEAMLSSFASALGPLHRQAALRGSNILDENESNAIRGLLLVDREFQSKRV